MTPKSKREPSPLATNAYGSLGTDFRGLSRLSGQIYGYAPAEERVIGNVKRSVQAVVRDASWKGPTAQAFRNAWEESVAEASKLSAFETSVADVLDRLAVRISWISDAFDRKGAAERHGAPIDLDKEQAVHQEEVNKAERAAAAEIMGLLAGRKGGWSPHKSLTALSKDPQLPAETRKSMSESLKGIDKVVGEVKPPDNRSWDDRLLNSNAAKYGGLGSLAGSSIGGTIGAGIGMLGLVGGPAAAVTIPGGAGIGAGAGTVLGGAVGGLWGLVKDIEN